MTVLSIIVDVIITTMLILKIKYSSQSHVIIMILDGDEQRAIVRINGINIINPSISNSTTEASMLDFKHDKNG